MTPDPKDQPDPLAEDDAIVAEAGKRADAATDGPWHAVTFMRDGEEEAATVHWEPDPGDGLCSPLGKMDIGSADAEFIAAAREGIPALIAIADKRGRALRLALATLTDMGIGYTEQRKAVARIREILGGQVSGPDSDGKGMAGGSYVPAGLRRPDAMKKIEDFCADPDDGICPNPCPCYCHKPKPARQCWVDSCQKPYGHDGECDRTRV